MGRKPSGSETGPVSDAARSGPLRYRRVVGLGLCVVDHLYVVERLHWTETRLRYTEHCVSSGGMTGTALAQAARLGCDAHVLSAVGDDDGGRLVSRSLRAAGVKTGRLVRSRDLPTTIAVVLVARRGGGRRFLVPDRRALERRAPDFDLKLIDARTLLLVDGHFPAQALRAVERARAMGGAVVGDFARLGPEIRALLPFVDYPVVPLEFAEAYGAGDPRRALHRLRERYGGTPVVTQGARGGLYWHEGRIRRFRVHRVKVRDTTGAGDVFHGALAAGLCAGRDLPAALDLAARAAALNCTALGATGRLMTREEMG
ncbi:MAG: PfkB family carbohydrate kinase [Myxococcales bacterium]|nr:PfkB family carbohydrate kinase [Myxococcales bacterium]